jgi:dTDP-4-dehydrorhamnose 3,5-epimerase
MEFEPLRLAGAFRIELEAHYDDRGYFVRTYDVELFQRHGLTTAWTQENQSLSARKGLIRGMHFQRPPYMEAKLVRVLRGSIMDVIVDLRKNSPTYGQWESVELADDRHAMLYIPKGFAHGFCTLSDQALVGYKVDAVYTPSSGDGLLWNDPALGIPWPVSQPFLSQRDTAWPLLKDRPVEL